MRSKWYDQKEIAISLRKGGTSIRDIEKQLAIPRSTLSGWFRNIVISNRHKLILKKRTVKSLVAARKKATAWHRAGKQARLVEAEQSGQTTLRKLIPSQPETIELALAMLYLGEGAKTKNQTAMGNSNPMIAKFFVQSIVRLYGVPFSAFTCNLHLRADQDPDKLKLYWSRTLNIPISNFRKCFIDKRTVGSKTYADYKGVCAIYCYRVAIQRKLLYIANAFCGQIAEETSAISSFGRATH